MMLSSCEKHKTTTTKARAFSTIHVSRSTGMNIDSAV